MEDAKPSRTAMRVALRRASHQWLDSPKVLDDPIAVPIVGPEAIAQMKATGWRSSGFSRTLRAFMVARSRVAEDALSRAVARGTGQYVVLGAGLDTFAYRSPYPPSVLRVFEVDHPATQAWKRRKLAAAAIAIPPSVSYAPVNFEHETLADGLARAGWSPSVPTFFSWLGVTMYLTSEAIRSTLALMAATPHGGGLAFDYSLPRSSLGWFGRLVLARLSQRVAAAGEPFRSFFTPAEIRERLTALGFTAIDDLGVDELNARYFAGRADGLRVAGALGRIVSAEI